MTPLDKESRQRDCQKIPILFQRVFLQTCSLTLRLTGSIPCINKNRHSACAGENGGGRRTLRVLLPWMSEGSGPEASFASCGCPPRVAGSLSIRRDGRSSALVEQGSGFPKLEQCCHMSSRDVQEPSDYPATMVLYPLFLSTPLEVSNR